MIRETLYKCNTCKLKAKLKGSYQWDIILVFNIYTGSKGVNYYYFNELSIYSVTQ